MDIERRALYNLLRMNWLRDPSMPAEPWQVDDYRSLPLDTLFKRLNAHNFQIGPDYFISLAGEVDTPEDFTALLIEDVEPLPEPKVNDQIYLLVLELWRRLVPDRPSLSIFCDDLDYQIHLYDTEKNHNSESIQDAVAMLQTILDENTDKGAEPHDVFKLIASNCAHDLESFLYDYISDQLDNGNEAYAQDLLDGFKSYVTDIKWFEFLHARLLMLAPKAEGKRHLGLLIDRYIEDQDLEFNLELLAFMVKAGSPDFFSKIVKLTLPLISVEGDFADLLDICADFYHFLDIEPAEAAIKKITAKRKNLAMEAPISQKDPAMRELLALL